MEKRNIAGKVKHVAIRTGIITLVNLAITYGISWVQGDVTMKNLSAILFYISIAYFVIGVAPLVGQDSSRRDAFNTVSSITAGTGRVEEQNHKVNHVNFTVKMMVYGVISLAISILITMF